MQEKLIKNSTWSLAAKLAATVLFFAADIVIARVLGSDQYAEWAFFFAILNMIYYVFWFGVNGSNKVFVSKANAERDQKELYIQAGIMVRTLVTSALMLLGIGLLLISRHIPAFRELTEKYPSLPSLLWMSLGIAGLNSFVEFFKENEVGVQNYRGVFILTTLEYAMVLLCGAGFAAGRRSSVGVGAGYLIAYLITTLSGFILIRRWNELQCWWNRTRKCLECAKHIFRYALPLALIGLGGIVLVEMDTFMLGLLSTAEEVSNYAIAKQICTKASHINNSLAMGTLTAFSVISREDYREKRRAFARVTRINLLVTVLTGLAMFLLSDAAIRVLYGENYLEAAAVVRYLVPYYILYGLSAFYALFLDFHGKAGKRSIWYLVMIAVNFILNMILIPRYGPIGASLATVISIIPYAAFLIYATYHLIWKELQIRYEKD